MSWELSLLVADLPRDGMGVDHHGREGRQIGVELNVIAPIALRRLVMIAAVGPVAGVDF